MTDDDARPIVLRVSVDGAQRLLQAWHDGRLEQALGFPVESLLVTPAFAPLPPEGGPGAASPPSSPTPPVPPPAADRGSLDKKKLGLGLLLLLLAMLGGALVLVRPDEVRTAASQTRATSMSRAVEPQAGIESKALPPEEPEPMATEPAALVDSDAGASTGAPPEPSTTTGETGHETESTASTGDPTEPSVAAKPMSERKAPRKGKRRRSRTFRHYRCEPAAGGFAIVVHARDDHEARVKACGSESDEGCMGSMGCELKAEVVEEVEDDEPEGAP
ncbi:hypothetical protein [Paraliomyxa miuraensis]|uniref:hypothetical protein n=1 Tax=Paraliomyxa miuraensis TaxID=376150 RepID=UPI00224E9BA9|nr:hypothetical protein [Paraliomyxa miuraensis]MCX4241456.1 hypothetical protein [Paraliomyxa miuraensis]